MTAFGNAFRAARKKAGGGGGTFMFGGKKYNTKIKEEVSKPASRKSSGGETGSPIVITGTRHPVTSAVHKANVTNTAPGAVTKAQGPSVQDVNNARNRAYQAKAAEVSRKAGWTR